MAHRARGQSGRDRPLAEHARRAARRTTSRSAGRGRGGADLAVPPLLLGPELQHVAEHRDAAARRQRREGRQRGAHGGRVGVVGVVEQERPRGVAQRSLRGAPRDAAPPTPPRSRPAGTPTANAIAAAARKLPTWCGPATGRCTRRLAVRASRARNRLPSASATTSLRGDVGIRRAAEPHHAAPVPRRDRGDARVVGVGHEGAAGLQTPRGSRLSRRRSRRARRNTAGAPRPRGGSPRRPARRRARASTRSPGSESPISPTIHSGARGRLTTDIGNPIWLFWLPGVFSTAKRRREHRRREVLGRRLAGRARDRGQAKAHLPLRRDAQAAERVHRLRHDHRRKARRQSLRPALAEQGPGAPRGRVPREVVAVHARAADRDEEVARAYLARVDRDAGQRRRALRPRPGGRRNLRRA